MKKMNKKQRGVIAVAYLVLAAMLIFPSFHETSRLSGRVMRTHGYHFIGNAPRRSSVNIEVLLMQILALGVTAAGWVFVCRD